MAIDVPGVGGRVTSVRPALAEFDDVAEVSRFRLVRGRPGSGDRGEPPASADELAAPRHDCEGEGTARCASRRSSRAPGETCVWPLVNTRATPARGASETLSFGEALALIGISRNTLYRLAAEGRIPGAQKLGKAWRFHRGTLLHFLAHPELYGRRR